MSFQRSYSKVWWGSDSQEHSSLPSLSSLTSGGFYSQSSNSNSQPSSLLGNLSCIQEVEDDISKISSWHKQDSPGSLRSQDSGFSDNEESHQLLLQQQLQKNTQQEQQTPTASPGSVHSVATPPTVVRRVGNSSFYSPLISDTRRISFTSGQRTPKSATEAEADVDGELKASRSRLFDQLDSLKLDDDAEEEKHTATESSKPPRPAIRRRRRLARKPKPELEELSASEDEDVKEPLPPYNNETVTFGGSGDPEETLLPGLLSPLRVHSSVRFTASTSTPKTRSKQPKKGHRAQTTPVESWMAGQRWNVDQEVMCTLQHKSIAQEAYKNFTITTSAVSKLVRQLQHQSLALQAYFERSERVLGGLQATTLPEALTGAGQLLGHLDDFVGTLERRAIFFNETRVERRRYEQHLEQIRTVSRDARYSLERQHYISLESLLEDVQLLKRHTLITLRLIFERLVRVLVLSIEQSRCDLLLRANINMVATLMGIDYDGFASLSDAFVQNEAVRTLLVIVLDHRQSSVRALALHALATLCCAPQAINQLGGCGGIEILRDILQVEAAGERGAIERREAVSLLAQITAAWHGPEHRVPGLRDCAESLVAGLADLLQPDCCAQTLLLCAAALNNLSRMEVTSHYSIMSKEAIFRLIATLEHQSCGISVFLYEQIVGMLHNMSLNKKCHSHLANGTIINFITSVYQTEFYKTYGSRAECDAQRRSIKTILHTLTRLAHDSPTLGAELLEQWHLPDLLRQSLALPKSSASAFTSPAAAAAAASAGQLDGSYAGHISQLARHLLKAHQQEQLLLVSGATATASTSATATGTFSSGHQTPETSSSSNCSANFTSNSASSSLSSSSSLLKFNLTRQESFV
ncbi:LOW QUALITY PROTEIN: uncharacterized protein LOC108159728 [Drosophila miranda]|uniref:LOW QUALITY PROTEIN: uncharacterized protein LOC108159728 n=1 Tax=Drosophila miranda TaxID=7229 RepID=UPI00143FAFF8|nr:LOW QUALITY PROTEIN: uncharacterized protein LOC108159728 [Drosophila miranda]